MILLLPDKSFLPQVPDIFVQILETKGAKYRNIYFDSDSDAGKFALGVTAFPTTYVIDRNGNIVGEALLGGINNDDNLNTLQSTIDEVLAKDAQK